jgi:outer membrane lipoprotein SlyB
MAGAPTGYRARLFVLNKTRKGDSVMAKKQLVLAFFGNEAAADEAVKAIKGWDKASKEVKLGAIGVLVKDEKGKIKTHKLGKRKTGGGAVLGVLAAVLTGGISLLGGAVAGGILGAFFHKGLGMSKDDLARINTELDGGKAAVGILAKPDEAAGVTAKLAELGGKPETHEVSDEAVEQAEVAAETQPEEPAA